MSLDAGDERLNVQWEGPGGGQEAGVFEGGARAGKPELRFGWWARAGRPELRVILIRV